MKTSYPNLRQFVDRRAVAAAALGVLAVIGAVSTPQLLGLHIGRAISRLGDASPFWLWAAGAAFALALLGNGFAWRAGLRACGAKVSYVDAGARYAIGSLVNTFLPMRAGDAVRIALFSRTFDRRERLWTTGGVFAAMGAARALVLAGFVVAATIVGAVPLWPVLVLGGLVGLAVVTAFLARGTSARTRVSHLLDAFRALGSEPRRAAPILGWILFSTATRVAGCAAVAAALGVDSPLGAAMIAVPALDVAAVIPVTPGNFGVASATVMAALRARGVDVTTALSTGIAFHALETAASVALGVAGVLLLTPFTSPSSRRWTVLVAGTTGAIALVGGLSATLLFRFG